MIPLDPMPWARAGHNKKTGAHYTKPDRRKRMGEIGLLWAATRQPPLGELDLGSLFEFVFEHPDSHYTVAGQLKPEHIGTRPGKNLGDLDNLEKLIKDALNRRAYGDDAQISAKISEKRWAVGGERAHTLLVLWPL